MRMSNISENQLFMSNSCVTISFIAGIKFNLNQLRVSEWKQEVEGADAPRRRGSFATMIVCWQQIKRGRQLAIHFQR